MDENPYAAPRDIAPVPAADSTEAETIRNNYLRHEANVKGVGSLYFITSIFLLFGAVSSGHAILRSGEGGSGAVLPTVSGILGGAGVLGIIVGIGLRRLQSWARITAIVLSGLAIIASIFSLPAGFIALVIHAWVLSILASPKSSLLCSPYYREIIAATPKVKYQTSLVRVCILLGLLLLIVLGTIGYLAIGFR